MSQVEKILQTIGIYRPSIGIGDFLKTMHDTKRFKGQCTDDVKQLVFKNNRKIVPVPNGMTNIPQSPISQ